MELFERANQIVACPIARSAHWHPTACADANWRKLKLCRDENFHIWSVPTKRKRMSTLNEIMCDIHQNNADIAS